jgi:SRSO17 transposase
LTLARDELPVAVGLRLFLPEAWAGDVERRRKCGVLEKLAFRTKWRIALDEIARVVAADVTFGGVLADAGYGSCGEYRASLSATKLRWVLGVSPLSTRVRVRRSISTMGRPPSKPTTTAWARPARAVPDSLGRNALHTIEWRKGTKGALSADFAAVRIRVADGEPVFSAGGRRHRHGPGEEAWLIFERRSNGETKYHLSSYPPDATLETLVRALKARSCEQAHQQMKEELGLDHFEGRSWTGLHHHAAHDDRLCLLFSTCGRRKIKPRRSDPPHWPTLPDLLSGSLRLRDALDAERWCARSCRFEVAE